MKKIIALAVFLACCASAQQILAVTQQQGGGTPPAGNCAYGPQVGNFWNQIGGSTNGAFVCEQTGNSTLPTFAWVPIQLQPAGSGTTGTLAVANGKAAAISNSITLAGTDATTYTFPTTAITVSGAILTDCGSSASCATPTTRSATMKAVTGTIAFSAATTASVTGISPAFTSATSYTCSVYNGSHNYTWNFTTQTTTGFTLTAGTSNSDVWAYSCLGY